MRMNDLLVMAVLSAIIIGLILHKKYGAMVLREKLNNAKRSHLKALELLQERGYTIVDCDRRIQLCSLIDGKAYNDFWVIDFVVRKGSVQYLVKIASGNHSTRLGYRENRETLIGMTAVFGCPRLLLVDPERRHIRVLKSTVKRPFIIKLSRLVRFGSIFLLGAMGSLVLWYVFYSQGGF